MVNRWMKCRKSTVARLELNLFPLHFPPCFLSPFFSLSLPPHLHLLCSSWRERSVLPVCRHKEGGRGPFFFSRFHWLPLSRAVQPMPTRCLSTSPSLPVFLCLYIRPSPFTNSASSLSAVCQLRERGGRFSIEISRKEKGQRNKSESTQECERKWRGKQGKQSEEWGE